ncbi:glycoside hydrolase family 47 protein [Plicaturopsis crispa FD-325 SS-3]|nr:glycoside hydrolase family 47 protein [Plicaturopsis crispa FD-325 SS-3]
MKWQRHWPETLLAVLVVALDGPRWASSWGWDGLASASSLVAGAGWSKQRKLDARERTRDLWNHGFDNYMRYAFPLDELAPISCTGIGPDWEHPENFARNDVAGNFSLTLIDVLDTLVVLNDRPGFEQAVRNVIDWVSFDVNTKPQVFETTIRVLGGLLSGHIYANQTGQPFHLPWYRGELLAMAHDLGERLLPAFATPTGIPYARLNLRKGVQWAESPETCTAGAGSLILEFGTLSRLTGDDRFEKAAYKAFFALWNRRSDIGLVGNTINIWTGAWGHPEVTGIGAGIDSFYEYALKWYVLTGDIGFLDVWDDAYAAVMRYSRSRDGFWYRNINIHSGDMSYSSVDSLSAFWPGLQVLGGDVQSAIKSHLMYWNLWRAHAGLCEVWDIKYKTATALQYPLRPEFVESTWYLYRATRDPFYLDVAERILSDITGRAKVQCGLTGIQDLRQNARDDRMESFALSETLKYLFLLFDEDNPLHSDDSNYVLTTEGHILSLGREHLKPPSTSRRNMRRVETHQCPVYEPVIRAYDSWENGTGLVQGIRSRPDIDYSRELIGLLASDADSYMWDANGWCETPKVDLFSYDFILSPNGKVVPEDPSPSPQKLATLPDGYLVHDVTGIRTHIVSRLDGKGYEITKLGPHAVRSGQTVYIDDPELVLAAVEAKSPIDQNGSQHPIRDPDVLLRFFTDDVDPMLQIQPGMLESLTEVIVLAYTGLFGADLSVNPLSNQQPLRFGQGEGVRVSRDSSNPLGCAPYEQNFDDDAVLVERGNCTFLEKLLHAQKAGASGVIVISQEDLGVNPSATKAELAAAGDISDVAIVVLPHTTALVITEMMDAADAHGLDVLLALDPEGRTGFTESGSASSKERRVQGDVNRVLYLNGHPLLNTRLLA